MLLCSLKPYKQRILRQLCTEGEEGVSAAQPNNKPVLKAENESQMVDEHGRSTKLEYLNVENWPLESSFDVVSNFQDSMPGKSRFTEPERIIRASSLSSVSSSRMSSLRETSMQNYHAQNQKLETLVQQMDD